MSSQERPHRSHSLLQHSDPVLRLLGRLWARLRGSRLARSRLADRLPRPGALTTTALLLIAAQLLVRGWAAAGSWFMWDDYIFIADVARGETDVAWLIHSHFSLVQPIAFVMVALVAQAGFTWWVYAAHIVLLQALASLACWWMLRVVFGRRRVLLFPLVFYLLAPFTVPGSVWWSVALYQHTFHIAIFGAITCHVLWLRSGRPFTLIGAFAFVLLGLGSYLKAPLIVAVLVGISWLWFSQGTVPQRVRTVARQWPAWLGHGGLVAGYMVLWASQQSVAPPRQACQIVGVFETSILETVGTGLAGGPWAWRLWTGGIDPFIAASDCVPIVYRGAPELIVGGAPQSLTAPPLAAIAIAWTLVALLLAHAWARRVHALRGLWIAVPYLGASAFLVFAGRAATFGSQVSAREIRYFADLAAIGAFCLAVGLVPIVGSLNGVQRRDRPKALFSLPPRLVGAMVTVFAVGSLVSTVTYVLPWHERDDTTAFPERAFVRTVERSLDARPGGGATIADLPLPVRIANPVIAPYNLPSRKLAPLGPRLTAVDQGNDLDMLDADGNIRPATIAAGPRSKPGPVDDCGYLVQQDRETIDLVPVLVQGLWVQIGYLANEDGFVDVRLGGMFRRIPVKAGLHTMLFRSEDGADEIELVASRDVTLCVSDVRIGAVTPREGASDVPDSATGELTSDGLTDQGGES